MVAIRVVGKVGRLLLVMHRTRVAANGHTLDRKLRILRVRGGGDGGGLLVVKHARIAAARHMNGRRAGDSALVMVVVSKRLRLRLRLHLLLLLQQQLLLKVLVRQGRRRLRLGERRRHHMR